VRGKFLLGTAILLWVLLAGLALYVGLRVKRVRKVAKEEAERKEERLVKRLSSSSNKA